MKLVSGKAALRGILAIALTSAVLVAVPATAQEEDPKAKDPNMAPIEIKLPERSFSGTPLDYWSEHLEFSYKDRPPFYAPKGTELLSAGKPVTSSDTSVDADKLKMLTDGDKKFEEGSVVTLKPGTQYVQLDLQKKCKIEAIVLWHFHEYERVYFDVIVKASNDPKFKEDVVTLYNNDFDNSSGLGVGKDKEYIEKNEGRLFDAKGTEARYLRFYSNGNSTDDMNTYIEIDVYGTPAK